MALDIGSKRTGIAISDLERLIVFPREEISHKNEADLLSKLNDVVNNEGIVLILAGMPKNLSGTESSQSVYSKKIIESIEKIIKVPVELIDERFSTIEAHKKSSMKVVDSLSAAILLENYLAIKA